MATLQRSHYSHNQLIRHHQLHLPFLNLLDPARFANKRLTAIQWPKLTQAQHLPGAVVISADPPATGGKHSAFNHLDMAVGNKKAQLVHGA